MNESKDLFSSFLDNILRSAEGLEQGRKNDSFSLIELDQISNFFTRVSSDCEKSVDGCLLLAQQGIDTDNTDKLLKSLNKQNENKEIKINENIEKKEKDKDFYSTYKLTNAIEKCELAILNEIDQNWNSIKKSIKFEQWSSTIFSKDPSIRIWQAIDAESFANALRQTMKQDNPSKIFSPIMEIMLAWKNYYFGNDSGFGEVNKIVDYITVLSYISKPDKVCSFQDHDTSDKKSIEIIKWLCYNAKSYLEYRYRYETFVSEFKDDLNLQDRNRKVMEFKNDDTFQNNQDDQKNDSYKKFREENYLISNSKDGWESIWNLIQSGLSNLITQDIFPYHDPDLNLLISLLKNPDEETNTHKDSPIINRCFTYAVSHGEPVFNMDELLKTSNMLYTILFFIIINNLKWIQSTSDNIFDKIISQNNQYFSKIELKDQYDLPMLDIILLNFEKFVTDIIEICINHPETNGINEEDALLRLPVIAAHFGLMFYNIGYFNNPYLKVIINDLISLLPLPQYADVALYYIVLSRGKDDEKDAINFLLSLSVDDINFDIEMYNFVYERFISIPELIKKLQNILYISLNADEEDLDTSVTDINEYDESFETKAVKILTLFGHYNLSYSYFISNDRIMNDDLKSFSMEDISILLEIAPVLVYCFVIKPINENKKNDEEYDDQNNNLLLLNACVHYILYALGNCESFHITDRIKMIENVGKFLNCIDQIKQIQDKVLEINFLDSIPPMIKIAQIITAFESGKSDEAMKIAFQTEVLSFNSNNLEQALKLLRGPGLNRSSALGTAIEYIVLYLSKMVFQYDNDAKYLKSILELCKYLTLRENVLANIFQIRKRLSLL